MILFLNQDMPVGKHIGKTVKEVIDTDLQYMIWFDKHVAIVLAAETKSYLEDAINKNGFTNDEINHLKPYEEY